MTGPSRIELVRTFVRYGYVPQPDWDVLRHFNESFADLKQEFGARTRAELVAEANRAANAAFEETFCGLRGDVVIPMSGGRDSRFILCMALELGLRDRIVTLTWGVPGGLDYEISARVSAALGVRHEHISTIQTKISFADLKQAFDNGAYWTDLQFAHFNQAWRTIAPGATAIVGFMGGPPVGCHYRPGYENADFLPAVMAFEALNQRSDFGASVIGPVARRLIDKARITLPEQLDLVYRQEGYLRRIVAPPGLGVRTPFTHQRWLRTMFAMPAACRVNGNLFTQMLVERFPRAFAIGTSGAYGQRADAPAWRRLAARRLTRISQITSNLLRTSAFATFDKYGDERDLLAALHAMPAGATPPAHARTRRHKSAFGAPPYAADVRLRAMLQCNLMCAESAAPADAAFAA